ncbi:MAG: hypothetical protein ABI999_16455 [Acidobacteriota bacterium]
MNMRFIKHIAFIAATTLLLQLLQINKDIVAQTAPVTLTKPATPEKVPNDDGFIQRWFILDPITANGLTDSVVQILVKKEQFLNQLTVVPHDGDLVNVGGAELRWHAVDTLNYNVNLFHFARAQEKRLLMFCFGL